MDITRKLLFILAISLVNVDTDAQNKSWMSDLPDDAKVRELSIPGSHDSATGDGFADGSAFLAMFSGVTQSVSISGQWDAGVRAFDLRPAYKADVDGKLQIYHGILETKQSLQQVLNTIIDKLNESPSEFVVILLRHEVESDSNSDAWADAMTDLLSQYESRLVKFNPSMSVKDARGKIIILSRDKFTSSHAGFITGWTHNENFSDQGNAKISIGRVQSKLYVQDFYECQTVERKENAVKSMLDYSTENSQESNWVINNASGYIGNTGSNSNIEKLAVAINKFVVDYLDESINPGRTGIFMLDFAGVSSKGSTIVYGDVLVNKIISLNNLYLHNNTSGLSYVKTEQDSKLPVYNIMGNCVGYGAESLANLPVGIYIYNGKKVLVQ